MAEVTVVGVSDADSWPCEFCEGAAVEAYIVTDDEETHGYCRDHLAAAILAAV